jgi:hypothetical protein
LCAKEAGEWIFRTVSYQGGVLQLRPFVTRPPGLNQLLPHASELIPYGSGEDISWLSVLEPSTFHFAFLEIPFSDTSGPWRMRRYYNSLEKLQLEEREARVHWSQYGSRFRAPYIESDTHRSRYAYAGRGVMRPEFVEAGIYGAELLVVDLETHAVLAFLRNFYSVRPASNGLGQLTSEAITRTCSNAPKATSARQFVTSVLKR